MRWLYLWALMGSWLVAVDLVERHAGGWSYIQGSTHNRENEGMTDTLGCTLYMVYAVLGVCCTWCMLYLVYAVLGVCCTWCMLYSVYAVVGVCCTRCMLYLVNVVLSVCCTQCNSWSWHGEIERDDLTLCSAMMVEKERWGMKMETNMEDTSRYKTWGVRLARLGLEDLLSVFLPTRSGVVPAISGMVNWLAHEILLSPSFSWWFPRSPLRFLFSTIT